MYTDYAYIFILARFYFIGGYARGDYINIFSEECFFSIVEVHLSCK